MSRKDWLFPFGEAQTNSSQNQEKGNVTHHCCEVFLQKIQVDSERLLHQIFVLYDSFTSTARALMVTLSIHNEVCIFNCCVSI